METTRRGETWRVLICAFEPIVKIGFGCVVAMGDKLLGGTICQQAFDLGTIRIEFAFTRSGRPSEFHSLRLLETQGLLDTCAIPRRNSILATCSSRLSGSCSKRRRGVVSPVPSRRRHREGFEKVRLLHTQAAMTLVPLNPNHRRFLQSTCAKTSSKAMLVDFMRPLPQLPVLIFVPGPAAR